MDLEIDLEPARVARVLAGSIAVLDVAYVLSRAAIVGFGLTPTFYPVRLFDLGDEWNLPALFGGALHLAASALLAAQAAGVRRARGTWLPWLGLSLVFVFLAFDEWLSIHEILIKPVRSLFGTSGFLRFAWVIPYGALTLALGAAYLRFLRELPARTRGLFLLSGGVFVAGALGCEMIGGRIEELYGRHGPVFWAEVLLEENLEMGGVTLFLYSILSHMRAEKNGLSVRILLDRRA